VPLESPTVRKVAAPELQGVPIIDVDVHNRGGALLVDYLPSRWQDYLAHVGRRHLEPVFGCISSQRPGASRLDAVPPDGGSPGSDEAFARVQLLDEYELSAAILNNLDPMTCGNSPAEFEIELCRASNDVTHDAWIQVDPRWYGAINVAPEYPEAAAAEIRRCHKLSDRFVQIIIGSRSGRPQGNPLYWPIYEAAVECNLPVAYHVGLSRYNGWTGVGTLSYYYEAHVGFPLPAQAMISSMIFEGLFERFPTLRIVLAELGWEWAVPYSWRLDSSWRVMREEVPHLSRAPSEYFRDHFWFSTQPCVEPEDPTQLAPLFEQFEAAGFGERLMFATDYPHWDMDSPFETTPTFLSSEAQHRILAGNASALYGIPVAGRDRSLT
jgi:predicted TIM-barrel fold metal-dependent hydrolase